MGEGMTENKEVFQMPGIMPALESLEKQLQASLYYLEHILIRGPRGGGKSYFVQIVKEHLRHYSEILNCDCENISKNELNEWLQYDHDRGRVIILDHLEELTQDDYRYLKALMKKVRVVGVTRDDHSQLPPEFIEKFQITVDIPPLYKHRADILHFIAKNYAGSAISSENLMVLCSYHWPGNYRELDKAVQQLFAEDKLPQKITGGDKLETVFSSILETGLNVSDLDIAINTCFPHMVQLEGELLSHLALRYVGNDPGSGVECLVEPLISDTILHDLETKLSIKSFFQLIFGASAMLHDQNILDLEPFGKKSLETIQWSQQEVDRWEPGSSSETGNLHYSLHPHLDNSFFSLSYFEKELTQEQLDAVKNFLVACKTVYEQNIKSGRGISQEKLSEIYEKQIKNEADEKKFEQDLYDKEPALMTFATLENRWKKYDLINDEILEMGQKGIIRFFVKVKNVTVRWFAVYGENLDPRGNYYLKDYNISFPITKKSIEDIWYSKKTPKETPDVQFVCPDEFKVVYDKKQEGNIPAPDNGYISEICPYDGFREEDDLNDGPWGSVSSWDDAFAQRVCRVDDLWAQIEDVKRYESDNLSKPKDQFKAPGYRTGDKELCAAFGVGPKSITTIRKRVKAAGKEFEYDPKTKEKRLEVRVINEIFAHEDKKYHK